MLYYQILHIMKARICSLSLKNEVVIHHSAHSQILCWSLPVWLWFAVIKLFVSSFGSVLLGQYALFWRFYTLELPPYSFLWVKKMNFLVKRCKNAELLSVLTLPTLQLLLLSCTWCVLVRKDACSRDDGCRRYSSWCFFFPIWIFFYCRGCLFYGPPGTGKTLVARALAGEYSRSDRKITFFMRSASDCMRKYVGESERQLRVLFEQVRLKCTVCSVRVETIIFCGQRF